MSSQREIRIETQSGVSRQIEAISLYSFSNMNVGPKMEHWRWHRTSELHVAVTAILSVKFGYTHGCAEKSGYFRYATFSPNRLAWIRDQHVSKPFAWLKFIDDGAPDRRAEVWYDWDIQNCPFEDGFIYVPSGWGINILKLAYAGVIGLVSFGGQPEILVGVGHDGTDFSRFRLKNILES